MIHASLFSGIGGFDLAAQWMGWENVLQCEIDPFCTSVLKYYFPNTTLYGDIRELNGKEWKGKVDILTGGFPCQPFSAAGRRRGTEDNRFLWPEMLRVIREIQPTWIIAENVRGIISIDNGMVFERVCSDMEENEYEVQPFCIPACSLNAPHKRERIWFLAHNANAGVENLHRRKELPAGNGHFNPNSCCERRQQEPQGSHGNEEAHEGRGAKNNNKPTGEDKKPSADTRCSNGEQGSGESMEGETPQWSCTTKETERCTSNDWREGWLQAATRLCSVDDGLPRELDGITIPKWRRESLKAYGNAIVPQVAYQIFQAIDSC